MARVPNEDEFKKMKLSTIYKRFQDNIEETISWCRANGLLAREATCETCGAVCVEGRARDRLDGRVWRCPEKDCRRRINIRKGSFFDGSHLHLWQAICFTYFWSTDCGRSRGVSKEQIMWEVEIGSEQTIVDWKQFCREV